MLNERREVAEAFKRHLGAAGGPKMVCDGCLSLAPIRRVEARHATGSAWTHLCDGCFVQGVFKRDQTLMRRAADLAARREAVTTGTRPAGDWRAQNAAVRAKMPARTYTPSTARASVVGRPRPRPQVTRRPATYIAPAYRRNA